MKSIERFLPVGYLLVALGLIAFLLPTALRPPEPPPPTSAEFSPDAPPNEEQQLTLSEMARGTTATAGAGQEMEAGPEEIAPLEPEVEEAAVRGTCFGDPPRATESPYAPPCAPAWQGDNQGATHQGVTESEVRIGVFGPEEDEGCITSTAVGEDDSDELRELKVYQQFFNENFETYERNIRLCIASWESEDDSDADYAGVGPSASAQRRAVTKHDDEHEVFGVVNAEATAISAEHEAVRRELIHMGRAWQPQSRMAEKAPFSWSFYPTADLMRKTAAEVVCKQLGTDPPEFNEQMDPTFDYSAPRRYGLIAYVDHVHTGAPEMWNEQMEACGLEFDAQRVMNFGDNADQASAAVTEMRANGVTTIVLATDGFWGPITFTTEAENQNYYPEWVHQGTGGMSSNGFAGLYEQNQWAHAIGVNGTEIPGGRTYGEHYRAYKSVDRDNEPEEYEQLWFWQMQQMIAGIHLAGPELTPGTFQKGMHEAFPRREPDPSWTIGGGYGPGEWTYSDYVALQWYDPDADSPDSGLPGAYRHPFHGERFGLGEIPEEPVPFFEDDPSHIERPPDDERR